MIEIRMVIENKAKPLFTEQELNRLVAILNCPF